MSNRGFVLLVIFVGIALLLVARLFWLQVIDGEKNATAGETRRTQSMEIKARRGIIYDRNGNVLATSVDTRTLCAHPDKVTDPAWTAKQLSGFLGGDEETYYEKLSRSETPFVYLEEDLDCDFAALIEKMIKARKLVGVEFIDDNERVYPYGQIGGQIIGFAGRDNHGLNGIEKQYEETLAGTNGSIKLEVGRKEYAIADEVPLQIPAQDGKSIVISMDLELQQYIEDVLTNAVSDTNATGGSITVYDASTGEIYASASFPLVDFNDHNSYPVESYVLHTVTDAFEPGSTFKPITASAGVDTGVLKKESIFDIPASLDVYDITITDATEHGDLTYTLAQIIAHSSNIGIVLAERMFGDEVFYQYIKKFGFGESPGIDYPGASSGILLDLEDWTPATSANVPFGQGIATSAIQLVRAYGVFQNGGVMQTPHFLLSKPNSHEEEPVWSTRTVISPTAAQEVTDMLVQVTTDGSGSSAAMDSYTVAGKTATAQYITASGEYTSDDYNISFMGFLPDTTCNLVCLVVLENPQASSAGSYFKDVMSFVVDRYKVAPVS